MAARPIPASEMRRRVRVWRQCGGNTYVASQRLGLNRQALRDSLGKAVRLRLITAREIAEAASRATAHQTSDPGSDVKTGNLLRRIGELESQITAMRKARTVRPTIRRVSRTEDFVRVVIPDSHGSHGDPAAIGAFLADLKALDPHEIVMLGDHVDCGGFLAQHHALGYVAETSYTYEDDIRSTSDFLDQIQAAAPRARIHYIEGNHEARVEKWCVMQCLANGKDADYLRRSFAPEFLLRLKERRIPYYRRAVRYDNLPIPGCIRLGKTYFIHDPGAGGRVEQYAKTFGGCVIFGHEHRARGAVVRTVASGEIGAWCPGTLAIQQPYYNHTRLTDHSHGHLVQIVSRSGGFLAVNAPIIDGISHLRPLLNRKPA
jgi:hypothetical protein